MYFKYWLESTTPYYEKIFDPALLTFQEFWEKVNPSDKYHSESAYNLSISEMKSNKSEFPILLNRKTINNVVFEFRLKKTDNYQNNTFVKRVPNWEILRINNEIQYYTRDELIKLGKFNRFNYHFAVFDGNQQVGTAQDEWGCLLVMVGQEYRRFGLGPILTKLAWEAEPGKETGGCTSRGAAVVQKVHTEFVRDYLQKGFYSLLVKEGKLTAEKVKQIIASAKLQLKPVKKINLSMNDPENWLLFHESGMFIIYDKKFKELYQEEDDFWKEKSIKAVGDVGGVMHNNEDYRLRILGAETEQLKKFMFLLCLTWTAEENNKPLYVYEEDLYLVDSKIMKLKKEHKNGWVSLIGNHVDYKPLERTEKAWRKKFDKYDEFKYILMEVATAKYGNL